MLPSLYHDDAAEEIRNDPSYTNHISATVMTPCGVRHQQGERRRRAWPYANATYIYTNTTYIHINTMHGKVK
jgi:hypothetical protein